ncbi:MAG: acetyl-CoA carboxylase biotin carboxylase subunit [Hyphomicrobiales bacterium]|nr:acetyl-CoA carboxylase biotin carboxylase subunit [Hyphomicrobiales bacterium]
MSISRVFVANRGEIAVRVIRACRAMDIETVVAVSEADRQTMAARLADRVVCIGPALTRDSYLNARAIITAALATKSDAIHPGYGFLSEDASFATLCGEHGLIFIGPSAKNIQQMGNKLDARALARQFGVPLAEGSAKINKFQDAGSIAEDIGYPVLLKAAAGGGGRGIRIVRDKSGLRSAFENASAEAMAAFGDNSLYLERYVENARHIEVQILADSLGNVVHLGERDCSLQRRHQKMIEEAPAFGLSDSLRKEIQQAAVTLAKNIGYVSAGTVEFIMDMDQNLFYFLEMNTRVQVEHPVTEEITGIDIVAAQLRIASGEAHGLSQEDVVFSGCAIECRINAESALHAFRPSPGKITKWVSPQGVGVRFDTHCFEGYAVPPFYDSLLGKLIFHGVNRDAALEGMQRALEEFEVEGVETTAPFLKYVMAQPDYKKCSVNTRWLERAAEAFMSEQPN